MTHDVHADYIMRRAALRDEAQRCRMLWATVALSAINDTALEVSKLKREGRIDRADLEIKAFERWVRSKDGTEVLRLAGIDNSDRTVSGIMAFVKHGCMPQRYRSTGSEGGLRS